MAIGGIALSSAGRRAGAPSALLPAVLALALLLCAPLFGARPADLSSDESLYLAEAYNIAHGRGMTYPSGEQVTHRAPLQPALMAPFVRWRGPDGAYAFSKIVVALDATLVALVAWRLRGALAGAIGGVAVAVSAYVSGLGTTLYVDPLQSAFMLLALLALWRGLEDRPMHWFATAGALTGLAFLVKEAAVQWAPLGAAAALSVPVLRSRVGARAASLYALAFAAVVAPWFVWVYAQTGDVFIAGPASLRSVGLVVLALGLLAACGAVALGATPRIDAARVSRAAPWAVAALVAAWAAFMLAALEYSATWPYPREYWRNVPEYLATVAPQAQPFFLLAAAWAWALPAARTDERTRIALVAAALYAPFALFAANRGLQLRDALPLVYMSYALLGAAGAAAIEWLLGSIARPLTRALVCCAIFVTTASFVVHEMTVFRSQNSAAGFVAAGAGDWDSPFEKEIATWMMAHLPAGARVLSSRLYFSSLYVDTDARFQIRQMPTVRVDIQPGEAGLLAPRSQLFRWGDAGFRARRGDSWLYLRHFPGKGYWIGLSEEELLTYIGEERIDYVVLTGDDLTFSSLAYASYFSGHPAFRLVHHESATPADQLFVYAVDRGRLATRPHSTVTSPSSAAALLRESGLDRARIEAALGTPLYVTEADAGLSPSEERAAIAGVDLGLRGTGDE